MIRAILRLFTGDRLRMYPDEMRNTMEYQARLERFAPEAVESAATSATRCRLVKSFEYSGRSKFYYET